MTLEYNRKFKDRYFGWDKYNTGFFIDPREVTLTKVDVTKVDHDQDTLLRVFKEFYNPYPFSAFADKEDVIRNLEFRINYILSLGYEKIDKEKYICLKLYRYFLTAYKSKNTKMWANGKDVVELQETTGYNPIFDYAEYNEFNCDHFDGYGSRYMEINDMLEILKSILIQSCNIDSLESSLPNTIMTSKFNIYETFYNYLLMDFNIQVIPKKIYNLKEEKFIEFRQNKFFVPTSEIKLKKEIESIKKYVKQEDRYKYFR